MLIWYSQQNETWRIQTGGEIRGFENQYYYPISVQCTT
jgi:hypothetical protein